MRELKGLKFDKTRVILDDTTFTDCEITNCEVVYSGASFGWSNTTLRNCFPIFREHAALTVSLLEQIGLIDTSDPRWKAVTLETPSSERKPN